MQDFQLGGWRVSPAQNCLQRDGVRCRLEHTPMQVLLYLVEHQGRLVSKDELLSQVWAGKVVGEEVLTVAISQVRKALGDKARNPEYIQTVPGKGYRLIAPVRLPSESVSTEIPPGRKPKVPAVLLVLFAVVVTVSIGWYATQETSTKPTDYPSQAVEAYQQGRFLLSQHRPGSATQAEALFGRAHELAPDMGEALWGMAEARLRQIDSTQEPVADWLHQASKMAPKFAPVKTTLGQYHFIRTWKFQEAESAFEQALELDPEYGQGHFLYAQFLLARGHFDLALQHTRQYMALAPENYAIPVVAWIYNMMGKYHLALGELDKIAQVNEPDISHSVSAQAVLENMGREAESFRHLSSILRQRGFDEHQIATATARFEQGGLSEFYRWMLDNDCAQDIGQYRPPLSQARYAVKAGDLPLAMEKLRQAIARKQTEVLWLAVDPAYEPLHSQPEYQQLVQQIGILKD